MDQFLDSIETTPSDDESWDQCMQSLSTVTLDGDQREVTTVVLASFPESIALMGFVQDLPSASLRSINEVIGEVYFSGDRAFVLLKRDARFNLYQLWDCQRTIVVTSVQSNDNSISFMGTSCGNKFPSTKLAVEGMAADQLTQSMMQNRYCSVLINEHTSIRVELDGLVRLGIAVSQELNLESPDAELIRQEFRRQVPINKKVPLYT